MKSRMHWLLGVAIAAIADTVAGAVADASVRLVTTRAAQRRVAAAAGGLVLALGVLLPATSLATGYRAQDLSLIHI